MQLSVKGLGLSVGASLLFALMPLYIQELSPLEGLQVFAQRVLWSIPAIVLLVLVTGQWAQLMSALKRLGEPKLLLALLLSSILMGVQWGLFVWSPLVGRVLEVSLGYFLLPLVLVLCGRIFYGEQLRGLQQAAVFCALLGVAHELWVVGGFSWVTMLAAVGYAPYFMLRRWMQLEALAGFVLEMLVLAPVAIWLIVQYAPHELLTQAPQLMALLPGLGLYSALAFGAMLAAGRLLPLSLFGLLSYLEPLLLFLVSVLLLGESFERSQWLTYAPIWLAVALSMLDSFRVLRRQARYA